MNHMILIYEWKMPDMVEQKQYGTKYSESPHPLLDFIDRNSSKEVLK